MLNFLPLPGQNLQITRDPIENNFVVIDTAFTQDHVSYNASGQGKHQAIHYVNQTPAPMAPVTNGTECSIYAAPSQLTAATSALFFKGPSSGAGVDGVEFSTFKPTSGTAGYAYLPSGLIIQWLFQSIGAVPTNITYPLVFPNAVLTVQIQVVQPGGQVNIININGPATTVGFSATSWTTIAGQAEASNAYIFALGY